MKLESAAGQAVQKKQPKRAKSVLIFNAVLNELGNALWKDVAEHQKPWKGSVSVSPNTISIYNFL
jgi:hypothetical protein